MAPINSGRKAPQEHVVAPPVDPLCRHHADVAPGAVGSFDHAGNRITTPSGAFVRAPAQADSAASRACRSLPNGALLLTQQHQEKVDASSAAANKKINPELAQYVAATPVSEVARFMAKARSLNATNLQQRDAIELDRSSVLATTSTSTATASVARSSLSRLPTAMRLHYFKHAASSNDFPRFTTVVPRAAGSVPSSSAFKRAAQLASAILTLKHLCDSNVATVDAADRFNFANHIRDNVGGIASTFRLGIAPRSTLAPAVGGSSSGSKGDGVYAVSVVDGPRDVLFHLDGFYWRIPVAPARSEQTAAHVLHQFNAAREDLTVAAAAASASSSAASLRKNDVDLATLTRCSAEQCAAALATVGSVCRANAECMASAFGCFLSVSIIDSQPSSGAGVNSNDNDDDGFQAAAGGLSATNHNILEHSWRGQSAFAPVSLGVYADGTAVLSWSTAFVNDEIAAAMTAWVAQQANAVAAASSSAADNNDDTFLVATQRAEEERRQAVAAAEKAAADADAAAKALEATQTVGGKHGAAGGGAGAGGHKAERPPSAPRSRDSKSGTPAQLDMTQAQVAAAQVTAAALAATLAAPPPQGSTTVEVVRTKPLHAAGADDGAALDATLGSPHGSKAGAPPRPGSGGASPRGVTPGAANRAPGSPGALFSPLGGASGGASFGAAGGVGALERVTITVPNALAPPPVMLVLWVPRTVKVPTVEPAAQLFYDFSCRLRDPAHSLYFAAALALWPQDGAMPPDVVAWRRSGGSGVEPLLYLCRSAEIDSFLFAVAANGGGASSSSAASLGPLPHDLAVLYRRARDSLVQMMAPRTATPHLSVLASMLALGGVVDADKSAAQLARFAAPAIVVSTCNRTSAAKSRSGLAATTSDQLFGPLAVPPQLFAATQLRRPLELQITWDPTAKTQRRGGAAAPTATAADVFDVRCVLRAPVDHPSASRIRFLLLRMAEMVDAFAA